MATITQISNLEINYLTKSQYREQLQNSSFNDNALWFVADTSRVELESITLTASGWNSGVYSLESSYPKAICDIEIHPVDTMSAAQFNAFNEACLMGSSTTNSVKAMSSAPTIDIPVLIKVTYKTDLGAPVYNTTTLLSSGWSGGVYSLESVYPATLYDIEISAVDSMTGDQYAAFVSAKIVGSASNNTIKAMGTVPSIDLPVLVKITEK